MLDRELMRQAVLLATSGGGERGSHVPFPRPVCGAVLATADGRVRRQMGGTIKIPAAPLVPTSQHAALRSSSPLPSPDPRPGPVRLRVPRRRGRAGGRRPLRHAAPGVVRGVARRRGPPPGRGGERTLRHAGARRPASGVALAGTCTVRCLRRRGRQWPWQGSGWQ